MAARTATSRASITGSDEAATPTGRLGRLRSAPFLRPLADRDYRIFWGGESISVFGDQFHFVALAWLVLQLTGSGLALGTVLTAAAIPRVILMLVGGAIADRIEPKTLIFRSNALRALVVGIVAALIISGRVEIWQLVVMAVIFGAVDAFFYPAVSTFLPLLVPSERLTAANGLFQATSQLIGLIGPAAAGVTVALIGTSLAFVLDAASFAIAAVAIALVHGGLRATTRAWPRPGCRSTPTGPSRRQLPSDVADRRGRAPDHRSGTRSAKVPATPSGTRPCARSSSWLPPSTSPSPAPSRSGCRGSPPTASTPARRASGS